MFQGKPFFFPSGTLYSGKQNLKYVNSRTFFYQNRNNDNVLKCTQNGFGY